jgi:hypothetical protein
MTGKKKKTTDRYRFSLSVLHPTSIRRSDRFPSYRAILKRGSGLQVLEEAIEFHATEPY